MGSLKRSLAALVMVAVSMPAMPALASTADAPSAGAMVMDILIARPVGFVITAVGAGAFVLSLPVSALGGNIEQAADELVVKPAKATFIRCLGCKATGRYTDPNAVAD